ncbi:MAG: aminoglycoside phosphotransferase family protein [Chloroflexi bacterium]|nr:aminoglycoside phosphotransferase family protein [Chloroflexota bacterium]
MKNHSALKKFLYSLRKRIIRHLRNNNSYKPGLPDGIDFSTIDQIIQNAYNEPVVSARFQHLSGWKPTGAFRICLQTQRGKKIRLIFKEAVYSPAEIPALVNFPARPGAPEYSILRMVESHPDSELARYLPKMYFAEEIEPGHHYRYIQEDLGENYRRATNTRDILHVCSLLARFHAAMLDCTIDLKSKDQLIRYNREFSRALQVYALKILERYRQHTDDEAIRRVLDAWQAITDLHLRDEFFDLQARIPIHGDTNHTNIHINHQDPQLIKMVDWEWAGIGSPFADLASLLKGQSDEVELCGFSLFISEASHHPDMSPKLDKTQKLRLFRWSKLERGLIDSAFLSSQYLDSTHNARFSLPTAINQALSRVYTTYKLLENGT